HARKVIAVASDPVKSPKGSRRILSGPSSSTASSSVVLLIKSARIVSHVAPPSVLYCHVPRLVSSAVTAMPTDAVSSSVTPASSVLTVVPAGFAALSLIAASAGEAELSSTGASLTLTYELPAAVSAPPPPCAPALPSLNVQSIWTTPLEPPEAL